MFDQLKQMKQLRDFLREIAAHRVTMEESGVSVVMRGDFAVEKITLNSALDTGALERTLLRLLTQAREKIQRDLTARLSQKSG